MSLDPSWCFQYTALESLPRLAWCARIDQCDSTIHVWHGPWVETWDDGFLEGAWDAPFADRCFDESISLAGTGARLRGNRVLFCAATNLRDRLYTLRAGNALFISNSLIFVMTQAGDEPNENFGFYSGEFLVQCLLGIHRTRRSLPTRRGQVDLHECANLEVRPDLSLRRLERRLPDPPESYAAYIDLVTGGIARSIENAMDPRRKHSYAPVVTLSRGYDSPMVAALARGLGCTEALTFTDTPSNTEDGVQDCGTEIGGVLGLKVQEFRRRDYATQKGCPEAEFCVYPPGMDYPMASMGDSLHGKLLLTGAFGDSILATAKKDLLPSFKQTSVAGLAGASMTEFRLRVGFINFPPLYIGAQHLKPIFGISTSVEMQPWSVGGEYDRPIARRVLEEAGVPDHMFATAKVGSAWGLLWQAKSLTAESRADFHVFLDSHSQLVSPPRQREAWLAYRFARKLWRSLDLQGCPMRLAPLHLAPYSRPPLENLLFHWGVERTRGRYRAAFDALENAG